jgi:hypothetical protein
MPLLHYYLLGVTDDRPAYQLKPAKLLKKNMSDSDEQPQEQTSTTPHNTSAGGSHSRPVTPTLKHKGGSPWNITKSDLRRGTSYPSPLALSNNDSNSLNNSSMRKRIVLNKQIISVQKEDGDIGHIEVDINDEEFTTQQATLQALADMGEIVRSSKPSSPVPGKGNLKDVLRRGSMAVERTVSNSDKKEKIDVPKGQS